MEGITSGSLQGIYMIFVSPSIPSWYILKMILYFLFLSNAYSYLSCCCRCIIRSRWNLQTAKIATVSSYSCLLSILFERIAFWSLMIAKMTWKVAVFRRWLVDLNNPHCNSSLPDIVQRCYPPISEQKWRPPYQPALAANTFILTLHLTLIMGVWQTKTNENKQTIKNVFEFSRLPMIFLWPEDLCQGTVLVDKNGPELINLHWCDTNGAFFSKYTLAKSWNNV